MSHAQATVEQLLESGKKRKMAQALGELRFSLKTKRAGIQMRSRGKQCPGLRLHDSSSGFIYYAGCNQNTLRTRQRTSSRTDVSSAAWNPLEHSVMPDTNGLERYKMCKSLPNNLPAQIAPDSGLFQSEYSLHGRQQPAHACAPPNIQDATIRDCASRSDASQALPTHPIG